MYIGKVLLLEALIGTMCCLLGFKWLHNYNPLPSIHILTLFDKGFSTHLYTSLVDIQENDQYHFSLLQKNPHVFSLSLSLPPSLSFSANYSNLPYMYDTTWCYISIIAANYNNLPYMYDTTWFYISIISANFSTLPYKLLRECNILFTEKSYSG